MAHTLKLNVNGSTVIDMGAGTTYSVTKFVPRHPKANDDGEYDVFSPIQDEIEILVTGSSADNLIENITALDRVLHNASKYYNDKNALYLTELVWKPQGATNSATVEVIGGYVEYPDNFLSYPVLSRVVEKVKVKLLRRPVWEGDELTSGTDFSFTASVSNNGASNFCTLPSLKGDIDAKVLIKYVGSGGNISNCGRLIAAVRANRTAANLIHILKIASPSGYSVTLDPLSSGLVASSTQAEFLSGNKARFTTASQDDVGVEFTVARWTISSNVLDQYGNFWVVVRYRDTNSTPSYQLRFRGGLSDGTNITYGQYSSDVPVTTRYNTSDNSEIGLLDLGMLKVPAVGGNIIANKNLIYELRATPLATGGALDIDYVALYPMGEMDGNNGIEVADFPYGLSSTWVYFDSRTRQEKAYVANTSGEKLFSPIALPSGGDIRLRAQKNGQRIYFTTCGSAGTAKHDIATSAAVTVTYVPQYIRVRGTT